LPPRERRQEIEPMVIPPLPHLLVWAAGALGIAALVRLAVSENRRVNEELARARAANTVDDTERMRLPKLRRDPRTGIYRPE
jgi:hypothetical protein